MNWDENPELNITPLVDIMLVLLAIMMVVAPTMVYEEKISLPDGSKTTQLAQNAPIHIVVDKHKNIKLDNVNYEYKTFMDNFGLYAQKMDRKSVVLISADKTLEYGVVMGILGAIKQSGFKEVSLVTHG